MAAYLAMRIEDGALDYKAIVEKLPRFKDQIDEILRNDNREDLIVEK